MTIRAMQKQRRMLSEYTRYVLAAFASLLVGSGLVWAGSYIGSCSNWTTSWLCRVAESAGGIVLAPGTMAEAYSGSRLLAFVSDALFYGAFFFVFYLWVERQRKESRIRHQ